MATEQAADSDSAPAPRSRGLVRWIMLAVGVVVDLATAIWWQCTALFRRKPPAYRRGDKRPVVVVPGVTETWVFMRNLMAAVHTAGHPVYAVTGLRRNVGTVAAGADEVMRLLVQEDLRKAVLLTHSKGGLVGKYAMTRLDPDGRIDRMIAISAPFAGSSLARYGVLPFLRALGPADPIIASLLEERDADRRITAITGAFDPLVPRNRAPDGSLAVRLDGGGHFRILRDVSLRRAVLDALGDSAD